MIIQRPEEVRRLETPKWVLVYGRRKTGKSFLVENFARYDAYYFIKRDKTIITGSRLLTYQAFCEILRVELANNKTVVVDEFHRLGDDFLDFLHAGRKEGKLILISSTLSLSKRLFGSNSPLPGFFMELPVGLISLRDSLDAVKTLKLDAKSRLETAILLREPLAVAALPEKFTPRELFSDVLLGTVRTVPALVGEIFTEEQRSVSEIYEGILRAIANGRIVSGEISSYLFARGLIKKDNPGIIQQYLVNLIEFGIIKKIRIYGRNRYVYKHTSPLVRIFYYADEKYNISERTPNGAEMTRLVDELLPKIVEDNVRELLASRLGLEEAIAEAADYDVDCCLLRFQKPEVVAEIKWKKGVTSVDVKKAEETLARIHAKRKILFVPDKKEMKIRTELEVLDMDDFTS